MQLPKGFDRQNPAPVLIAGATASGKSALALELSRDQPSIILNADALQVYNGWHILTARPSKEDKDQAPHYLDGHVQMDQDYSVGHWLRDVEGILRKRPEVRPIIVGGTGLYFQALTNGLAPIPAIPKVVISEADRIEQEKGKNHFRILIESGDPKSAQSIDLNNPARTRRAWEVLNATGKSIVDWQAETPAPLVDLGSAQPLLLNGSSEWLNDRIDRRFDIMMDLGALDEAKAALKSFWDPTAVSCQAIGAAELILFLEGQTELETAIGLAKTRTRQFAKRQRTWFRNRMKDWHVINVQ